MPDLSIPFNLQGRVIPFNLIDKNTGTFYNLSNLTVTLKIDTTDYVTNMLTKVLTVATPTSGQATWTPTAADWISFPNTNTAYFGQILLTGTNINVATFEFDIAVFRSLT